MLGKNLKPGILTTFGLITSVDLSNNDQFWQRPNVTFVSIDTSAYGTLTKELFPDEQYTVLHEEYSNEYRAVLSRIVSELTGIITDRSSDIRTVLKYVK